VSNHSRRYCAGNTDVIGASKSLEASEVPKWYMVPPGRLYVGWERIVYREARGLAGCISGSSWAGDIHDSDPRKGTYLRGTAVTLGRLGGSYLRNDRKFADFNLAGDVADLLPRRQ
jgi:hypothetical protein